MPHSGEYTIPTRAAIVTLRCQGLGWTAISKQIGNCSPVGVQKFMRRLLVRADIAITTPPQTLPLARLLEILKDEHHRGRRERFPGGSEVANSPHGRGGNG
ncbi:hypothetical protein IAQ61_010769 [Plenodomus lingam]|uniref:uncharacterized protein n=1 Tax=Leptosphaeria maculans TaxID=5022 RepID=UPI00331D3511|nr:hypothetical protein IAQ61_010769 [Plenodomus lingam]